MQNDEISDVTLAEDAANLVEKYMGHIVRRDGERAPAHCARVAAVLAEMRLPPFVIIAGLLHDIIEDAGHAVSLSEIRKKFGVDVERLVSALTKIGKGKKAERKHLELIENAGPHCVAIKLADNTINLDGYEHLKNVEQYVRYAKKIQAIGCRVLGEDHTLVIRHLRALRSASFSTSV